MVGLIKIIKTVISLISAIVVFFTNIFSIPSVITDLPEVPDNFKPVVRFTVASDVHLKPVGTENREIEFNRFVDMIKSSYEIAESDKSGYNKLDGIMIAGDFTDKGDYATMAEYKAICDENMKDETKLMTVIGNHDFKTYTIGTQFVFRKIFGESDNFHYVINGFHFIGISPSAGDRTFLNREAWLAKQLKIASEDNPNYPIFVTHHTNVKKTIFGSMHWGNPDSTFLLAQYPQVIDFSGHSHYPINDPRSVWQGSFTAVGTGTLSYFCSDIDGDDVTPENAENAAQMWVVEADANGSTRLRGYDLISHTFIGRDFYIEKPADKNSFAYGNENMKLKSTAPVYSKSAKISVNIGNDNTVNIKFPSAYISEDEVVFIYRISVTDENGKEINNIKRLSEYYFIPSPTSYTVDLGHYNPGKYNVTVTAENAYGKGFSLFGGFEIK